MLRTFPYQGLVVPRPPRTVLNPPSHYSPSVLPHISLQEGCSASSMPSLASKLTVLEMAKSPALKTQPWWWSGRMHVLSLISQGGD